MRPTLLLAPVFAALATLAVTGCASSIIPPTNILDARHDAAHPPTYAGLPLKSGQIVLTESPDATSFVFMLVPQRFYLFTHAGIVSMEDGEPFVYEISGEVAALPFHARLLDNVSGEVHRRPFLQHVSSNLYSEVIDPPEGADGEKIAAFARESFRKKVPFDTYFRFDEHEAFFCTELLELALRAGGVTPRSLDTVNPNPSLAIGMQWLGVPPNESLPAGAYYDPKRYVGALGQFPSRTAAHAFFEAKREIYRRFHNKNQRLGFVFELHGSGRLEVRPDVLNFANSASHLFDGIPDAPLPGDPRITRAVRRFADATFGPAPDGAP